MTLPNVRPYANVIVWRPGRKIESEAFFVLTTHGTIREIKTHKDVEEWQYLEYVAFSLFLGKSVTFEICNVDMHVTQSITVNDPT